MFRKSFLINLFIGILLPFTAVYGDWSSPNRLTDNPAYSGEPSVAVDGPRIIVAWTDFRDNNYEIYTKWSSNGGGVWSADTRLSNTPTNSFRVQVAAANGKFYGQRRRSSI